MADFAGRGGKISVGSDDTTWGTEAAPDRSFYTFSTAIETDMHVEFREALNEALSGSVVSSSHNAGIDVGGDVEIEPGYEGLGLLLYHATWGTTSTTGTNPYTHTYTLAASPPTVGLTIEQVLGTGSAERFAGCRISTFELYLSSRGRMRARMSVIGKSGAGRISATNANTTTNHVPILASQAGAVTWNSITAQCTDFRLRIDNRFERQPTIGSQYTAEPYISGPRVVEIEVTVIYDANTLYSGYTAGTASDMAVTFTSGARSMAFTLHNAVVSRFSSPVNSHGRIMQTLTFRGVAESTDYGLSIVVVNTQSSRVAA